MPPVINTVTPATGISIGGGCVTIDGTGFALPSLGESLRVLFDGVESPEAGAINDTTIVALTPPGVVGVVDVTVENTLPGPVVETDVLVGGFTYQRPQIETNRDLAASADSALLVLTRELITELRRTVLANTHHDMHPEYVDAFSAAEGEEVQADAPSLKVTGPTVVEDRFYSLNGKFDVEGIAGVFRNFHQPTTVRLDYSYVGVTRTKGEAFNLWNALTLFLNRQIFLDVAQDGSDKANGVVSFELNPNWDERAEFTTTTRQGFHQFTGSLHLRGVHTVAREVCESRRVDDVILTTEQITP